MKTRGTISFLLLIITTIFLLVFLFDVDLKKDSLYKYNLPKTQKVFSLKNKSFQTVPLEPVNEQDVIVKVKYYNFTNQQYPCSAFSGVVVALGSQASATDKFEINSEVFGLMNNQTDLICSEYISINQNAKIMHKDNDISFADAALIADVTKKFYSFITLNEEIMQKKPKDQQLTAFIDETESDFSKDLILFLTKAYGMEVYSNLNSKTKQISNFANAEKNQKFDYVYNLSSDHSSKLKELSNTNSAVLTFSKGTDSMFKYNNEISVEEMTYIAKLISKAYIPVTINQEIEYKNLAENLKLLALEESPTNKNNVLAIK